jgi:thiol-disulfide isomerase/thioredoxin
MKRLSLFWILFSGSYFLFAQNNEFELKVTLKPFKKQFIYLGYYFGKQKPIVDSVMLDDNSSGVFRREKKMEKGIYLIGYPGKMGFFEILVDKEQKFSIYADTADVIKTMKFTGSPDNELFLKYQDYTSQKGKEMESLKKQLALSKTKADSAKWQAALAKSSDEIQAYRKNLIEKNPDATITALLKAMQEPEIPPASQHPGGKYDSLYAYRYFKDHYWDDAYFFDERLARTTFFDVKLDQYFDQLVYPDPDSVIKELDWMLGYASANKEMERFLLVKYINRYLNPKYMWEDAVYVHLFEKYFSQKEYPWLNEAGKKIIFERAYSMMANLFGSPASDIDLPDSSGKKIKLYSLKDSFTVVVFWDPTCGHCKETLPKMDSVYRAKWKKQHVKIYAVAKESDGTRKDWLNFINEKKLEGWVHVYYSKAENDARIKNNIPGYSQLYDVQSVPTIYLLDSNKRILAKKIPFEQVDEVLAYKLKTK